MSDPRSVEWLLLVLNKQTHSSISFSFFVWLSGINFQKVKEKKSVF